MATVREYVETKLAKFDLAMSEIELDVLLMQVSADDNSVIEGEASLAVAERVIALAIPELLLEADVTEGGYSKKRDKSGVTAYYALLCAKLDLPNKLIQAQPTVQDRSNVW